MVRGSRGEGRKDDGRSVESKTLLVFL